MTDHLANQAENLTRAVSDLGASVSHLARTQAHLARTQAHIRRVVAWTVAGLAIDVALTVLVTFLYSGQQDSNRRISANNERITEVQGRTSNDVLCPLYKLILDSEKRAQANPALSPDQRTEQAKLFAVIHDGYNVLRCVH